jgi:hypothetical protein
MRTASIITAFAATAFASQLVHAAEPARIALVIGNSAYEGGDWPPLVNPVRDALLMAATLHNLNFDLVGCEVRQPCVNVDRQTMDAAIRKFGQALQMHPGAIAFFYYAGHGVQARVTPDADDENFLVPIKSGLEASFEAPTKAISLEQVIHAVTSSAAQGVVVLDACRAGGLRTRGPTRGLARIEAGGALIAYAAEPGKVALDEIPGRSDTNGPYVRRLTEQLSMPGKSITDVFLDVRKAVINDSRGDQKPEALIQLNVNIYLNGQPQSGDPKLASELAFWQGISGSKDPQVYREYLNKVRANEFPGTFKTIAEMNLAELKPGGNSGVKLAWSCRFTSGPLSGQVLDYSKYPGAKPGVEGAPCTDGISSNGVVVQGGGRLVLPDPRAEMTYVCKFQQGPRAGQTQDYSKYGVQPIPVGAPCQDGVQSSGVGVKE